LTDVATFGTAEVGGISKSLGGMADSAGNGNLINDLTGVTSAREANAANAANAQAANAFSAQQAQQQMDFQERMSNTSYQRAVKDMEAAGINPMMAINNGGASTPSGAAGTANVPNVMPVPTALQGGLSSARDFIASYAGLSSAMASTTAAKAAAVSSLANAKKAGVETDLLQKKGPEADVESTLFGWLNKLINGVSGFSAKHVGTWDGKLNVRSPGEPPFPSKSWTDWNERP